MHYSKSFARKMEIATVKCENIHGNTVYKKKKLSLYIFSELESQYLV